MSVGSQAANFQHQVPVPTPDKVDQQARQRSGALEVHRPGGTASVSQQDPARGHVDQ
ncbi:hypothetical protein GXW83_15445 [Streptacidiphilus sp. PB12-B1b]|uniref:hypothetical protein n=1 Tax=Streptacidiphilus sp. PB12-B1b TaxID=2705012 RepID=UPI0015FCEB4C|nr:hypothetical protein [Streptacidiphilus sp. PB12-B1b]QMU76912.1 hypothetical protein GXW83_15445 [Streptacidiphilus sp. PB12-B1b]